MAKTPENTGSNASLECDVHWADPLAKVMDTPPLARLIYLYFLGAIRSGKAKSSHQITYPGHAELARVMNVTPLSARRSIEMLVKAGAIKFASPTFSCGSDVKVRVDLSPRHEECASQIALITGLLMGSRDSMVDRTPGRAARLLHPGHVPSARATATAKQAEIAQQALDDTPASVEDPVSEPASPPVATEPTVPTDVPPAVPATTTTPTTDAPPPATLPREAACVSSDAMCRYLTYGVASLGLDLAEARKLKPSSTNWTTHTVGEDVHVELWNDAQFAGFYWYIMSWIREEYFRDTMPITLPIKSTFGRVLGDIQTLHKQGLGNVAIYTRIYGIALHWQAICALCGTWASRIVPNETMLSNPMITDKLATISSMSPEELNQTLSRIAAKAEESPRE
jgi:hypothetical protein